MNHEANDPMTTDPNFAESLVQQASECGSEANSWLGKRQAPRFQAAIELDLEVEGNPHFVRCTDVSEVGLQVLCRVPLASRVLGETVRIKRSDDGEDGWVPVRIQHITQTVGGYKVGLEYIEDAATK